MHEQRKRHRVKSTQHTRLGTCTKRQLHVVESVLVGNT